MPYGVVMRPEIQLHGTVALLGAEAVPLPAERVAEMEAFSHFMRRSRARLRPGSIEAS